MSIINGTRRTQERTDKTWIPTVPLTSYGSSPDDTTQTQEGGGGYNNNNQGGVLETMRTRSRRLKNKTRQRDHKEKQNQKGTKNRQGGPGIKQNSKTVAKKARDTSDEGKKFR